MATFPKAEAEIVSLAQAMVTGLTGDGLNPSTFPAPPVPVADLATLVAAFTTARNAAMTAESVAQQAVDAKDAAMAELVDGMKSDLRYAETTAKGDSGLLSSIGWSGRRPPTPLQPAGQALLLEVRSQGEGTVDLAWKPPIDGGKPSAYHVLRRERPEGPWTQVAAVFETEVSLTEQPRGKEYEYRVIAANKAGEGEPSNTVMVVL